MFEEFMKKAAENVDLYEVADKVDSFAEKIENGFSFVIDFLNEIDGVVEQYVNDLHLNAEALRQRGDATVRPVAKEETQVREVTREQKIEFVRGRLKNVGIKDSRWDNPAYVNDLSDEMVNHAYTAWGGK